VNQRDNGIIFGERRGLWIGEKCSGRNSLRGPGLFTADWGLDKNFQITERFKLQLRWEVFNALNVANWGNPGGDVTKCNASVTCTSLPGQITGVSLPMRNQQIGLRFTC